MFARLRVGVLNCLCGQCFRSWLLWISIFRVLVTWTQVAVIAYFHRSVCRVVIVVVICAVQLVSSCLVTCRVRRVSDLSSCTQQNISSCLILQIQDIGKNLMYRIREHVREKWSCEVNASVSSCYTVAPHTITLFCDICKSACFWPLVRFHISTPFTADFIYLLSFCWFECAHLSCDCCLPHNGEDCQCRRCALYQNMHSHKMNNYKWVRVCWFKFCVCVCAWFFLNFRSVCLGVGFLTFLVYCLLSLCAESVALVTDSFRLWSVMCQLTP